MDKDKKNEIKNTDRAADLDYCLLHSDYSVGSFFQK